MISFVESHTRVQEREFADGKAKMRVVIGRKSLEELLRNGGVTATEITPALIAATE
jgi:hypothetical protein